MKPTYIVSILLFSFIATCSTFAQQSTEHISGRVTDTNGEPLPGATISIKGEKTGAVTTADGTYTLQLPGIGSYIITASYIGYQTEEKRITTEKEKKVNFRLSEDQFDLGTVVVTGTRTPKLLKDAPIITRVITSEDIKKVTANNVADLLKTELPGIEFTFSMDQQTAINMQGFGGNSVLFLVDGERLAGETLNNVDYERLNLDNVERIEIVKGAASTLYGSSAIGGVINIITRESDDPWNLNLNSRFSEHNDQRYGGTVGFNAGKFNSLTNVQYNNVDTYAVDNPGDFSTVFGSRVWNFKERLIYHPLETLKLTGRAGYYFRERNKPGDTQDRYRGFSGGMKANYTFNIMSNLEVGYTFDQYDKSDYQSLYKNDVRDYSNVQHNVHALYNYTFNGKHTLTVGADYLRDYLMSYQFTDNADHTMHTADAFGQFDWNPTERLNVIAGLRFDYFSDSNVRHLSPHLGMMYKIGSCSLRGSYSQGFRSPTLKEMYMVFNMANMMMIYGNPDLKSETSHNFSVSAEYTKNRYNFSVTGYYNLVHNRINTVYSEDPKGQIYTNTDKMDIAGIDANISAKYPCGLGYRLSYTYSHEFMRDGQKKFTDTRPHTATVRIDWGKTLNKVDFNYSLNGRVLSKVKTNIYNDSFNNPAAGSQAVEYPGYMIWDLTFSLGIIKGVNMNLAVNNLFDYVPDYYYFNSPTTTGTNLTLGLSLDIDRIFKK